MKTAFTYAQICHFLVKHAAADSASIQRLVEGQVSQAVSFQDMKGAKFVLRIADTDADFKVDEYAANHFSPEIPIPKIVEIGRFQGSAFYCQSEFIEGQTAKSLSDEMLLSALPEIQRALARTFTFNCSETKGYGPVQITTGNAHYEDQKTAIAANIEERGIGSFKQNADNIGLDASLIDDFFTQFRTNISYTSEIRRLCHGDPGLDNVLIRNNKVVALIDWGQMNYGDWMSDFARLDFWAPGKHGDAETFAATYGLESENLAQRKALYYATNALWAIEFADVAQNVSLTVWLKHNVADRRLAAE